MKKILPLIMLLIVPSVAFGAKNHKVCCNSYAKNMYGDLNLRAESEPRKMEKDNDYYIGIHAGLSFLSWDNEYKNQSGTRLGSDDFFFKPVVGGDVFVGRRFEDNWRGDVELGYVGKYSEGETEDYENYITEKTTFDLETFYLMANGYYDFDYGFYAGAGLGIALTNVTLDHSQLTKASKTRLSPMGALTFGWSYALDEKVDFDLRYRFALYDAGHLRTDTGAGTYVKTDVGLIIDNALSAGIRYNF